MPTLVSKLLRKRLGSRARRRSPVSSFTVFLLGFGLVFWMIVTLSVVTMTNCGMGYFWTTGWQSETSVFQIVMLSIALIVVVWFMRLHSVIRRGGFIEATLQGVFITVLVIAFLGFRALMFPYGMPSHKDFFSAYERVSPPRVRLSEKHADLYISAKNWKYDYPPLPVVEFEFDPRFSPDYNLDFSQIFSRPASPLPKETKAAKACMIEQARAQDQYQKDRETLEEYWEEFRNWYALNKHRYER